MLLACEEERGVKTLARDLGVEFSHSVSATLAQLLPELDSYLGISRAAPAPKGYGVQSLDLNAFEWVDVEEDVDHGLYRYQSPAGITFRMTDTEGKVYAVDLAVGIYAALAIEGIADTLKWFPDSVNGRLQVPLRAPLPTLHARAATLCSGLAPQKRGRSLVYVNVPREIADRIARSVSQRLVVIEA